MMLGLSLFVAACEPSAEPEPVKEPLLMLTSEASLHFEAAGGEATIEYVLENEVEGTELVASCSAEWIESKLFAQESKLSLIVAPNTTYDERDATLVVAYGELSFEVSVKQAGAPFEGYELSYIAGTYYEPGYWGEGIDAHNYFCSLASVDDFTTFAPNGVYVELDFWADSGDASNPAIPLGEYTIDTEDSGAPGTIGAGYSRLLVIDENQIPVVWILPVEGKVTVCSDRIEGYLVGESGERVTFRYQGTLSLPQ